MKYFIISQRIESESNSYECNTLIPLLVIRGDSNQVISYINKLEEYQEMFLSDRRFHFEGSDYYVGNINNYCIVSHEITQWDDKKCLYKLYNEKLDKNQLMVKNNDYECKEHESIIEKFYLEFKDLSEIN